MPIVTSPVRVPAVLLPLASVATVVGLMLPPRAEAGPVDRVEAKSLLEDSAIQLVDLNDDCWVSDVDVALLIRRHMAKRFGPDLLPGDLDSDGAVTAADQMYAIAHTLRLSFGKAAFGGEPVGPEDVAVAAAGVLANDLTYDANLDGRVDAADVQIVIDRLGFEPDNSLIYYTTLDLYAYITAIQNEGEAAFMAAGCSAGGHVIGISRTWPAGHPRWWKPNHMESFSQHSDYDEHALLISLSWPANHDHYFSTTWPEPAQGHHLITTNARPADTDEHKVSVSGAWPAGHAGDFSLSWDPPNGTHDKFTSIAWWPHHEGVHSRQNQRPPAHAFSLSEMWEHATELSQNNWPPNHHSIVSMGWQGHQTGLSASYPPNHVTSASNSWPGPQPAWPASHLTEVSENWSQPAPGSWPVFPPDHSWWTTFQSVNPDIIPFFPF